jgi:hypothetical protein
MKKGRRPRRRPRLKLSDRAGPDQCPVPGENALFPAQIAGFLAVSRPVPVYPVFLNYVVPVQSWSQVWKFVLNVTVCYILGYGLAKPLALKALAGQSLKVQENVAMLVGMCLYTGFNYLGQKFFAFKKK